ncbi:MAG: TonB-dependent receptor [Bryobacterales bacterium]|nr:TonB-dependent receptor [Bryobacterales bacterium]
MRFVSLMLAVCLPAAWAQKNTAAPDSGGAPRQETDTARRTELNLMGKTDTAGGESRRNENIYFNLVDNNALKELNVRLGTTATIIDQFHAEHGYFSAEFGNAPSQVIRLAPSSRAGFHGSLFAAHLNSIFSARTFFQVGEVKPAHENNFGFVGGAPVWKGAFLTLEGSENLIRGVVNGNVLVPRPDERTPLAADPAVRALLGRWLSAYPRELPNRTDINERALNTNAPQRVDLHNGSMRLDQNLGEWGRVFARYLYTYQHVEAFELVSGQNPNTDTHAHTARLTWNRAWSADTVTDLSAGYDRIGSLLAPEKNAVGPNVAITGLTSLGPESGIPINRAQNLFRYSAHARLARGKHNWTVGSQALRRQFNGIESDTHRGYFSFTADFGRDAITNFRLGAPTQYIRAAGNIYRGFRNWDLALYAGDEWRVSKRLTFSLGLRYEPVTTPVEVNGFNTIPYPCDCNNLAPRFGFAWRAPGRAGVLRGAYGLDYGEIYPVTFQQVRFAPPLNNKIVVPSPDLLNPLGGLGQGGALTVPRPTTYVLDPRLVTPYAQQYNFSWEPELSRNWRVQLGYVGSRSNKLLLMWYLNRAHPVAGIPQTTTTVNERRENPDFAEIRRVINGSRGYFDAARISLVMPRFHGVTLNTSYWFSKAMDLGSGYSNTAYDADSRQSRSQNEFLASTDMKGLSNFDQPHAFLTQGQYAIPSPAGLSRGQARWLGGWSLSGVLLLKQGTPFTVGSGSDAPGFGNVDANGGDRPNIVDASILGRTIGNPDTSRALLPRAAFQFMQPTDARGNLGRNTFRRGGIRNVNASLTKEWAMRGEQRLRFRAESVNLFNTPQFAEPGFDLVLPNFGQITNTLNDGRTFRFWLNFLF